MILEDFNPFVGQHCETTATGCLLKRLGIVLSEPMLFGLGEGLGFIFWNMKSMDFPFIGGRIKADALTQNLCRNLNLDLKVQETSSLKKAWSNLAEPLRNGQAVGLKLDCFHLDYFKSTFHFAGHYVAAYGFDEHQVFLVDTAQQGGRVSTSLKSLALARNEKGPMASRNKSFTIGLKSGREFDHNWVQRCLPICLKNNATDYLNPPIKNLGYKGIAKTAKALVPWFNNSPDVRRDFETTSMLMERAGTGGALFRNLYRDFLKEALELLPSAPLEAAYRAFVELAKAWTHVSQLLFQAGESKNIRFVQEAAAQLEAIAEKERSAMELLLHVEMD